MSHARWIFNDFVAFHLRAGESGRERATRNQANSIESQESVKLSSSLNSREIDIEQNDNEHERELPRVADFDGH